MLKKIAFTIVLVFTLTSCSNFLKNSNDKNMIDKYLDLSTYEAEANITYISNTEQSTFTTVQQANIDGRYRIEVILPENVAGSITVNDGNQIYQFNERISKDIYISKSENRERSELFLTSFVNNYKNSDDVTVTVGTFKDSLYTVLDAKINSDHPLISSEKLWINNETQLPEKLVIYDKDNAESIIIEYTTFEYNKKLDENLFNVQVK
ncbi:MAG: hypothetical protein ACK5LY_10660 [Lachnospirales bacterium]